MEKVAMCGYRCDLCSGFAPNIKNKDEREMLSNVWNKYYDLNIPTEKIYCDGCRCTKEEAKRIDKDCPVRKCVIKNQLDNCGECIKFPCGIFNERKGLSFEEAKEKLGSSFCADEYNSYLLAYDNMTRLGLHREKKTDVYFVRHAHPDLSIKDEAIRPLSEKGTEDTKKVTDTLIDKNITAIYSSPFKRSIDTIKDFAKTTGLEIRIDNDFRERKVGEWVEDFETFSQKQWEDFDFRLAQGESLREVQERNISALFEVINNNMGKSIAIATHGTALSTIINYFNPDFGYDNFWNIVDKMPYILHFRFEGMELEYIKEIEIK